MTIQERWKPIDKHPGYWVSNQGRIRNRHGRIIKQFRLSGGMSITVSNNDERTTLRIARIVGAAFSPGFADNLYPKYKDHDHTNCRAANLRWVRRGEIR